MRTKVLVVAVTLVMVGCKNPSNNAEQVQNIPADTVVVIDTVPQTVDEDQAIQFIKKHILTEKDLYTDYDGGTQLADFFVIELIDKDTFLKNKGSAVQYFTLDTTSIQKSKGILRLPCNNGAFVTLTDNLSDGEHHKEYSYVGQVKALNAYLISGIYWEDWNYFFVDKNGGRTVQTFANFPYLSADERYIVSVDVDSFEGAAYIDLYEVSNRRYIDPMIGMYIKNWIPLGNDKMYWSTDSYLYMAVLSNRDYWAAEGNYAGLDQYIRLRPVA
ncbi:MULTISPECIES: hypothetical protein [unclassified Dysgonomonas]|uniref:hypothetical protein n=1 Tax=unclassified Dysgonomonas TaxID=2630389 RepID=UPI000681A670|nr:MULTISPECIES: hypothetical protein [unclassified Dysgonomonas]MBD8346514.1 hypothetical protein [Dysgonomonas sp. HGC4]MBF0574569.1 hypothetical protein [Dysgonomonas sp. GY617]